MRYTKKDFLNKAQRLEEVLNIKLTTNIWHRHYSVYTQGPNDSCQKQLVSASNARNACDQIWAILNVLDLIKKEN